MSVRMNISLDDDLKTRMDKADKKEDTNWSQVAAAAFEGRLAEIASKKEEKTMDDVIQRLKASKVEEESQDYKWGVERGEKFAKKAATHKELQRLHKAWDEGLVTESRETELLPELRVILDPEDNTDWGEYMEKLMGEEPSLATIRGFWDGAVEFFNEVKDKV